MNKDNYYKILNKYALRHHNVQDWISITYEAMYDPCQAIIIDYPIWRCVFCKKELYLANLKNHAMMHLKNFNLLPFI